MSKIKAISVGQMAVGKTDLVIRTSGVGTCVVICVFDKPNRIGGAVHAMLPVRRSENTNKEHIKQTQAKYVDEAIEALVLNIEQLGGKRKNFRAKIVGGACMLKTLCGPGNLNIGNRNVEKARQILKAMKITIDKEDVGGESGRIVDFNIANGVLTVCRKL
jgi:chemotaxis protein CheD